MYLLLSLLQMVLHHSIVAVSLFFVIPLLFTHFTTVMIIGNRQCLCSNGLNVCGQKKKSLTQA